MAPQSKYAAGSIPVGGGPGGIGECPKWMRNVKRKANLGRPVARMCRVEACAGKVF